MLRIMHFSNRRHRLKSEQPQTLAPNLQSQCGQTMWSIGQCLANKVSIFVKHFGILLRPCLLKYCELLWSWYLSSFLFWLFMSVPWVQGPLTRIDFKPDLNEATPQIIVVSSVVCFAYSLFPTTSTHTRICIQFPALTFAYNFFHFCICM